MAGKGETRPRCAGDVGKGQTGGLVFDWSRGVAEYVEHTVVFMWVLCSLLKFDRCGALPFCRDEFVFPGSGWW